MGQVFGQQGRWAAALEINGNPVAYSQQIVQSVAVKSGIHRNLPSISLSFNDQGCELLRNVGCGDGTPILIYLNDGAGGFEYTGSFVTLGGPQAVYTSQGTITQLNGVLNALPWMFQVTEDYINGPSSAMIALLFGKAGLTPNVDTTQDVQTWLPNREPLSKYAQMVASRAYNGDSTAMIIGVTDQGEGRYKDINNLLNASGGLIFGRNVSGEIKVAQFQLASKGATNNMAGAAGMTLVNEMATGVVDDLDQVAMGMLGGSLPAFSAAIQGAVGQYGSKIIPSPIDANNVHPKYYDGLLRTLRVRAAYSNDVHILTFTSTPVQVLDSVTYICCHPQTGEPIPQYSGSYIVTNVVRTIVGSQYMEKITLTNNSGGVSQGGGGGDS